MNTRILSLLLLVGLASSCATRVHYSPQTAVSTNSVTSKSGRTFKVIQTTEKDRFEEPTAPRRTLDPAPSPEGADSESEGAGASGEASDSEFEGKARAAAKTSVASGPFETFATLKKLRASLPTDKKMMQRQPPISHADTSDRVTEERRNVTVSAFLFAAKKEDDNDYHVILGHAQQGPFNRFLNVEVSGLPSGGPFLQPLTVVRQQFEDFFQTLPSGLPGRSGYEHYAPPIPVRVSGSLFYDIDHKPGQVGPAKIKPTTSWEIHPLTRIEFEP